MGGTKQGDPLSTLSINSLLQYITKPKAEKLKRCNHGVRLAERDPNTNLSSLSFADDILPIIGSLKHTTTMLDDLTTATTANGLQLHSANTTLISKTTSKRGKKQHGGSSRHEHRDPTARRGNPILRSTHLFQKRRTKVEFEHLIKCAWATFTTHRQAATSPKYPLRDRLKLSDGTATPSLFYASGTWTMTEDMNKKHQTTQRRMRMIIQAKRQAGTSCTASQAASGSVDVTANAELHDSNSEQGGDTTEHNNQDLSKHEESSRDADSNHCFDEILEDNPEDELRPWVDYIKRATPQADHLPATNRITSWILRQTCDLLEAGSDDCQAPRRWLDQARLQATALKVTREATGSWRGKCWWMVMRPSLRTTQSYRCSPLLRHPRGARTQRN